jgi:hypothetical protein
MCKAEVIDVKLLLDPLSVLAFGSVESCGLKKWHY